MATSDARHFATFDVVVLPFPYADRLAEKQRPALASIGASGGSTRLPHASLARSCGDSWGSL
jgi:hypothetical protein